MGSRSHIEKYKVVKLEAYYITYLYFKFLQASSTYIAAAAAKSLQSNSV